MHIFGVLLFFKAQNDSLKVINKNIVFIWFLLVEFLECLEKICYSFGYKLGSHGTVFVSTGLSEKTV